MSRPDMETTDKASRQLASWVEAVQRGDDYASNLVAWVVSHLPPDAVNGLAADWDDGQDDAPRPWLIQMDDHGDPDAGAPLFWSNDDGWTEYEYADRFTDAEKQTLTLPMGGEWLRKGGGSK